MRKLYLITVGAGHLGNTLVRVLCQNPAIEVRAFLLPGESASPLEGLPVAVVRGDMRDLNSLRALFACEEPCERFVVHTAGIVSIASRFEQRLFDVNVIGTSNILRMCAEYKVAKFVHVSSVHAMPPLRKGQIIREILRLDPADVVGAYAKTKAQASQLVLNAANAGLNACLVYPSGIIGPNDYGRGHTTQLILDYMSGRLVAGVRGGYDFVDVRDVADGICGVLTHGVQGEGYILSGRFCTVPQMLGLLQHISGNPPVRILLPRWLAKATAPLAEQYYKLLHQPPLYTKYSLYTLSCNSLFSYTKAHDAFGYEPRPLSETLRDTIAWLSAQGRIAPSKSKLSKSKPRKRQRAD